MKKLVKLVSASAPYILLFLPLVIVFWQVFFNGSVVIDGDNFHLNIPMKYLLSDALNHGYFPFWNPYVFAGIPYAADLNLGTFNPINILYFILSVPRALTLQVIADLFLIGVFQFIFLKQFFSKLVAVFGGLLFMLSGTVFIFTSNVAVLNSIVYIPLLFFLIERFSQTKKGRYFVFLVFFQTLQIVSGHPQITYYTIFFILLYFLFGKKFLQGVLYVTLPILLSAFQLLPFFEYALQANRPIGSLEYSAAGAVTLSHIVTIFLPTFFGTKQYGNWWGSQVMLFGYIGVPGLTFFVAGLFAKFKKKSYYLFSLVIAFLLSLGKWGILFFFAYFLIPGWSAFRSPADIFVFVTFFMSLFTCYGIVYILRSEKSFLLNRKLLIIFLPSFIFLFILLLYIKPETLIFVLREMSKYNFPYINKLLLYSTSKIEGIFQLIVGNISFFVLFLIALLILLNKNIVRRPYLFLSLILLIEGVNLLLVDSSYLQLAPLSFYDTRPTTITKNNQDRIFSEPVVIANNKSNFPGPEYFYNESEANLLVITDNHTIPLKIQGITGYSSLILKNYSQFIGGNNITGVTAKNVTLEKLNALAVSTTIKTEKNGVVIVTKNLNAKPRVSVLDSGKSNVEVRTQNPNRFTISIDSDKASKLIIADSFYPGWQATVNGKNSQITIYKGIFEEISIPKGKSVVSVFYSPTIWIYGLLISLLGIVLTVVCLKCKKIYV